MYLKYDHYWFGASSQTLVRLKRDMIRFAYRHADQQRTHSDIFCWIFLEINIVSLLHSVNMIIYDRLHHPNIQYLVKIDMIKLFTSSHRSAWHKQKIIKFWQIGNKFVSFLDTFISIWSRYRNTYVKGFEFFI